MHKYTPEHDAFIASNVKGRSSAELTEMFNAHFSLNLKVNQIAAYKKNHGHKSGLDCRFKTGQRSWNRGKKGLQIGGKETQFKKGNKPHNHVPVGSERVNGDGYIDVKIADGKGRLNWKAKQVIIWEEANGPVPKGYAVIFGDGNRRNFDLNNLILVSRRQLAMLNKHKLIQGDADLTRTGVIVADILSKLSERSKAK